MSAAAAGPELRHYLVAWEIDAYAYGPHEAAEAAERRMRAAAHREVDDFAVRDQVTGQTVRIDLVGEEGGPEPGELASRHIDM
ncbi:hypothetical protein [Streptacidiphilus cavernicola]|uniref:Uncharacterized protein n=1 Tax=Streptacidiphilus cavernicola TaxID=3342716 RepID=A0ABV6VYW3_9ACTN